MMALSLFHDDRKERLMWGGLILTAATIIFSIAIVQTAVILTGIFWIIFVVHSRGRWFRRSPLDWPSLAFVAARLISIAFSSYPELSVRALYVEMPYYILFFVATHALNIRSESETRFLFRLLVLTAALAATIGTSRYLMGIVGRANSTTSGYYTLGTYLSVILALSLVLANTREVFPRKWLWVTSCIAMIAGIVFTFNRMHWILMVVAVLVTAFWKDKRLLIPVAIGCGLLVVLVPDVAQRFSQTLNIASQTSGRDVLWKGALMIGGEHPIFGFGQGTFTSIFPLVDQLPDKGIGSWHNDYLQVYMESGAVGLLALLWLVAAVVYHSARVLRSSSVPRYHKDLTAGILAAMLVLFVGGGVLDTLVGLLFRILLAILALIASADWAGEVRPTGRGIMSPEPFPQAG